MEIEIRVFLNLTVQFILSLNILPEANKHDPASEDYFRELSLDRATVPAEYNAVTKGMLDQVIKQVKCGNGSCKKGIFNVLFICMI